MFDGHEDMDGAWQRNAVSVEVEHEAPKTEKRDLGKSGRPVW